MSLTAHVAPGRGEGPADFVGEIHFHFPVPIVNDRFHLAREVGKISRTPKDNPIGRVEVLFGHLADLLEHGDYSRHTLGSFNDTTGHLLRVAGARVIDHQNARRWPRQRIVGQRVELEVAGVSADVSA